LAQVLTDSDAFFPNSIPACTDKDLFGMLATHGSYLCSSVGCRVVLDDTLPAGVVDGNEVNEVWSSSPGQNGADHQPPVTPPTGTSSPCSGGFSAAKENRASMDYTLSKAPTLAHLDELSHASLDKKVKSFMRYSKNPSGMHENYMTLRRTTMARSGTIEPSAKSRIARCISLSAAALPEGQFKKVEAEEGRDSFDLSGYSDDDTSVGTDRRSWESFSSGASPCQSFEHDTLHPDSVVLSGGMDGEDPLLTECSIFSDAPVELPPRPHIAKPTDVALYKRKSSRVLAVTRRSDSGLSSLAIASGEGQFKQPEAREKGDSLDMTSSRTLQKCVPCESQDDTSIDSCDWELRSDCSGQ